MRCQCHVCGQRNGSCNKYILKNGQEVTICPSCLAFSNDETAKIARQAKAKAAAECRAMRNERIREWKHNKCWPKG